MSPKRPKPRPRGEPPVLPPVLPPAFGVMYREWLLDPDPDRPLEPHELDGGTPGLSAADGRATQGAGRTKHR